VLLLLLLLLLLLPLRIITWTVLTFSIPVPWHGTFPIQSLRLLVVRRRKSRRVHFLVLTMFERVSVTVRALHVSGVGACVGWEEGWPGHHLRLYFVQTCTQSMQVWMWGVCV